MFRKNLSGTNIINEKVLNNVYISSKLHPYTTDVDIGSAQSPFRTVYSSTISTGNMYAVLASIGNLSASDFSTDNINATNATIQNLITTTINSGETNTIGNIITTGGSVGIGTTAPSSNLEVADTVVEIKAKGITNADFIAQNQHHFIAMGVPSSATFPPYVYAQSLSLQNDTSEILLATNGNVGIGAYPVANPLHQLSVNGSINATSYTGANVAVANISSNNLVVSNVSIANLLTVNHSTSNAIITNVSSSSAIVTNFSTSNLRFGNMDSTIHITNGNVGVNYNTFFFGKDEEGKLRPNTDVILGDDPLTVSSIAQYADLLGIDLETAADLFNIPLPDISNYQVVSLRYQTNHFTEQGLIDSKLALNFNGATDKHVLFLDNSGTGTYMTGMSQFKADFGSGSVTIGNVQIDDGEVSLTRCEGDHLDYTNGTISNLVADDANISSMTLANLRITNDDVEIPYVEGDNLFYTNATVNNLLVDDANISSMTLASLRVTNDDVQFEYLESNDIWTTNATVNNLIVDDANISSMTLANLRITNDDVEIPYVEGDNLYYTNATINNLKTSKIDVGFLDISSATIGNNLIVNGTSTLDHLKVTGTTTLGNIKQNGICTFGNLNILGIDEVSAFNLQGDGTASNLYITYGTVANAKITELDAPYVEGNDTWFDRGTIGNLVTTNITAAGVIRSDKLVTNWIEVSDSITTGAMKVVGLCCAGNLLATTSISTANLRVDDGVVSLTTCDGDDCFFTNISATNLRASDGVVSLTRCEGDDLDFTYGTISNLKSSTVNCTKVIVTDTTPTLTGELTSKSYVDGISYIGAGTGLSKSGSNINLDGYTKYEAYNARIRKLEAALAANSAGDAAQGAGDVGDWFVGLIGAGAGFVGGLLGGLITGGGSGQYEDPETGATTPSMTLNDVVGGLIFALGNSTGSVWIRSDGNKLLLNDNISTSNALFTNITTTSLLATSIQLGATNTIGSIFTTGGNVGIGTTSPTSNLEVADSVVEIKAKGVTNADFIAQNQHHVLSMGVPFSSTLQPYFYSGSGISIQNDTSEIVLATNGNVAIGAYPVSNPLYQLDVNGGINATSYTGANISVTNVSTASLNVSGITSANALVTSATVSTLLTTNISSATLNVTNINNTNNSSATLNLSTGITSSTARITDAFITNLTASNFSLPSNLSTTNISSATLNASTGITSSTARITDAFVTNLTASNFSLPSNLSTTNISSATLNLSTGITSASARITNAFLTSATTSNIVNTNVSSGTLNLSTGITSSTARITDAFVTNLTASNFSLPSNLSTTNISSATLNLSTGITSASARITNAFLTSATTSNIVNTNVSSATLNLSTGITSASALITNANITNLTAANFALPANLSTTNISSATLNLSTGITSASARITNINNTNITSSSLIVSNIGVGTTSLNAPLQFSNAYGTGNRKIVLYEAGNNGHQIYGFGVDGATLRYLVSSTSDSHVFYAAASSSSSTELFRIKGDGNVITNCNMRVRSGNFSERKTIATNSSDTNFTFSVSDIESGLIEFSSFTANRTGTLPTRSTFTSAGYQTGDYIKFFVSVTGSFSLTVSLPGTGTNNNYITGFTNVQRGNSVREYGIRISGSGIDVFYGDILSTSTSSTTIVNSLRVDSNNSISTQGSYLHYNRASENETWIINQRGGGGSNAGIRFGKSDTSNTITEWSRFIDDGSFLIGNTAGNLGMTKVFNPFIPRVRTKTSKTLTASTTLTVSELTAGYIEVNTSGMGPFTLNLPSRSDFITAGFSENDTFTFTIKSISSSPVTVNGPDTNLSSNSSKTLSGNKVREYKIVITSSTVETYHYDELTSI